MPHELAWPRFCSYAGQMATAPSVTAPPITAPPVSVQAGGLVHGGESLPVTDAEAVVPEFAHHEPKGAINPFVGRLPVELEVTVPVRNFRVRNLVALEKGAVIESQWKHGEDMPLSAGAVQLAWTEFEVVESRLAVRITRLA
jgi:flagellar motor switch/type III secretory pathway protein FliN